MRHRPPRDLRLLRVWTAGFALSLLFFFLPPDVEACSCVSNCTSIGDADAVFEATVVSVDRPSRTAQFSDAQVVTLRDLRAWPNVTVVTTTMSCGYRFEVGIRYFIVATRTADGRLAVHQCSGTRPQTEAHGLVDYVQILDEPPGRNLVWGTVRVSGTDDPVPSARVDFVGPVGRSVLTDGDGRYTVGDLVPGAYTARVVVSDATPYLGTASQVHRPDPR